METRKRRNNWRFLPFSFFPPFRISKNSASIFSTASLVIVYLRPGCSLRFLRGELVFRTDNLTSPKSDQTRGSLNFCRHFFLIFRNLLELDISRKRKTWHSRHLSSIAIFVSYKKQL